MQLKKKYQQLVKNFQKSKKQFPKFLKVIQKKDYRKVNFILLTIFFLTFPVQNSYLLIQPSGDKPLVRPAGYKLDSDLVLPVNISGKPAPDLSAKSVLVIDLPTKTVLYSKNPDLVLLPASTTKIMTALVGLEHYKFDDILVVKNNWKIGQTIGLKPEEKLTFKGLLYGLLVGSGNDAAYTIAENYPGGMRAFIARMNEKGQELSMKSTHFVNVSGVEDDGHVTTVHDLGILSAEALKNKEFSEAVATGKVKITDIEEKHEHLLENTNQLLDNIVGVKGVKTGWTESAGECLVAYIERPKGKIITVLLGSQDRFGETETVIDWVYNNFEWRFIDTIRQ